MYDVKTNHRSEAVGMGAWVFAVLVLLAVFALVMTLVLWP